MTFLDKNVLKGEFLDFFAIHYIIQMIGAYPVTLSTKLEKQQLY